MGDKEKTAIAVIKKAAELAKTYSGQPLYLGFSGGKDSLALYHLAERAGVEFEAWYNPTTLDPAENIRYIRQNFPNVRFSRPRLSFFDLVREKGMLPTQMVRYCCAEFKERQGLGRVCAVGVRKAESMKRRNLTIAATKTAGGFTPLEDLRPLETACYGGGKEKIIVRPLLDWSEAEIWGYIRQNGLPINPLYKTCRRVGCLFCPMKPARERLADMAAHPHLFRRLLSAATAVAPPPYRARNIWNGGFRGSPCGIISRSGRIDYRLKSRNPPFMRSHCVRNASV